MNTRAKRDRETTTNTAEGRADEPQERGGNTPAASSTEATTDVTETTATSDATETTGTTETSATTRTSGTSRTSATRGTSTKKPDAPANEPSTHNKPTEREMSAPACHERRVGSEHTVVPRRKVQSQASTSKTVRKRREIEQMIEIKRQEAKRAQAEQELAKMRLELIQLESETDLSDLEEGIDEPHGQAGRSNHIDKWVEESTAKRYTSHPPPHVDTHTSARRHEGERLEYGRYCEQAPRVTEPPRLFNGKPAEPQQRAAPYVGQFQHHHPPPIAPRYMSELHVFTGEPSDWIAFRATYRDTEMYFSEIENIARLRKAIQGKAKEAVRSMLFNDTNPNLIIDTLQRRFGQPRRLIRSELEIIEKMKPLSDDARNLAYFAGVVANMVNTIQLTKRTHMLHSEDIYEKILDKMSIMFKFKWFEYKAADETQEWPVLLKLASFLNRTADQFDACEHKSHSYVKKEREPLRNRMRNRVHMAKAENYEEDLSDSSAESENESSTDEEYHQVMMTSRKDNQECPACNERHSLKLCKKFTKLSIEERWEIAKKAYMCFRCLSSTHRGFNCRAKPCGKNGCKGSHHRLLHREKEVDKEPTEPKDTQATSPSQTKDKQTHSVNTLCTMKGYLKIVPLKLYGPSSTTEVYALLDEGATITLIEEEVADCIGASGPVEGLCIEGIGGHRMNEPGSRQLKLKVQGKFARNIEKMNAYTISRLSISSQMVPRTLIENCPHLSDIADVITYENVRPRIIIGQDNWHLIVSQKVKSGDRNKPVASLTRLGWTLHGCATSSTRPVLAINHIRPTRENRMDELIKHHFSIESLGVTPKTPSNDPEKRANEILEATCRRLPEGRFEAGLLWRTPNETLPNNRENAMKRLVGIEKRLKKDEHLKCEYERQVNNLLNNDYAEAVQGPSTSPRTWYLPHFAVKHPQKGKVRLVFDAAARSGGKCLNDVLLTGPDLLQSLYGVLLRFREGPIAVVSDIKEMFLRIQVSEQDRDSLRFLWRERDSEKPKEYRMKSLIFGAASSPCTAIYAKNRNAADFKEQYPDAVQAIERNHYMDDYLQSFQSEEIAKRVISEVDCIHKHGGFLLRGWASNKPNIIKQFPEDVRNNGFIDLGKQDCEQVEKTLGLRWNISTDHLNFTLNLRNTPSDAIEGLRPPTKREATSAVMSVFDPLGLASPITIQGRAMLQDTCRSGIGWDELLKECEERKWKTWLQDLEKLQDLNIPRCITTKITEGELHVFCDASEKAYATAIYWRAQHPDGHIEVKLLSGKSRVAPLKPVSIPRLELQAALLGCRLAATVTKELDLTISRSIYWTDSRTVLSWIKSDPRTFKPFVAHRLAEIEDHTKPAQWRWIPTAQNVADDATRSTPSNFNTQHRWFTGPKFLYYAQSKWPEDKSSPNIPLTGEEKPNCAVNVIHTDAQLIKPERFSKFTRLLRTTARVYQAVDIFKSFIKSKTNQTAQIQATKKITQDTTWRIKKTTKTIPRKIVPTQKRNTINFVILSQDYICKAEKYLIRKIQNDSFKSEKQHLKNNTKIPKNSKLRNITLTLDKKDDIIYLSTRVSAATYLTNDYKNPAILDGSHYITLLLITEKHCKLHHGNHQTVMNEIRQSYYVTKLRTSVKKIVRECLLCKIRRQKPQCAPLGDLPKERLNRYQRPFTCTAVDYFGPMTVTVGRRHEKRWGALFTCLTTRAIHLELANSLSTDSMILALRRMAARRSTPVTIFSDNGTNFVGANKELQEQLKSLSHSDLTQRTESYGITWKFIPPGAPHMGGAWERLVRSVKTALAVTLNERSPKEEVLHTLLLEVEHVVNSRPLTEISLDPDADEALTPNHFLIGKSSGLPTLGTFHDSSLVGTATWRTCQRLADHFWTRWTKEYLPTLLPRRKSGRPYTNPKVGDIVLIVDSSLPRGTWPRGEIMKTHPGPDGTTRIVDVRTKHGILRRPVTRLIILTTSASCQQNKEPVTT